MKGRRLPARRRCKLQELISTGISRPKVPERAPSALTPVDPGHLDEHEDGKDLDEICEDV